MSLDHHSKPDDTETSSTGATGPSKTQLCQHGGLLVPSSVVGSLLGTAVGDAIGLPYEALSKRRARRLLGEPERHRFLFGRGMVSDDTEHSCIVAQALIASAGEPEKFARALSTRLRWWLLGLPAGIGWATLRATIKLWLGFSPHRSGVFSAGNGPPMRSAVIGAAASDPTSMARLVTIATRITHTDPKAAHGAVAVALAAHLAARHAQVSRDLLCAQLDTLLAGESARELVDLIDRAARSAESGETAEVFAESLGLGCGVPGYVNHTVPVAIQAWLGNQHDFRSAILQVVRCGGDTDTTAAIVGGIAGSGVGKEGIPAEWLGGLFEWPRTQAWMETLGNRLETSMAQRAPTKPPSLFGPWLLARNAFFTIVVLAHVARRCLPPY